MPVFSIIIPVYKVEKYIKKCVESVINQTFSDFEAIFVDDCGGDNSIKIVEEYAKQDNRIKIFYHEKNRGLSAARNTALNISAGKYIVCLDSDDWIELNALELIYDEFQKRNTNSIWFEANKYNDDSQTFSNHKITHCKKGYVTITQDNLAHFSDYSWIKAYLTESIKKYNIKWPEGLFFEDGQFYYEYFSLNPETYITEHRLYNYRDRQGSIVKNYHNGIVRLEDIYQIVKNIRQFYIDNNMYDKYKIALLKLLQHRIDATKNTKNNYDLSIKLSKDLLEVFRFSNEFKEFDIPLCPLISVILPINHFDDKTLSLITILQGQSYRNIEIILTSDNEKIINSLEKYTKNDSRIKITSKNILENPDKNYISGDFVFLINNSVEPDINYIQNLAEKIKKTPYEYLHKEIISL